MKILSISGKINFTVYPKRFVDSFCKLKNSRILKWFVIYSFIKNGHNWVIFNVKPIAFSTKFRGEKTCQKFFNSLEMKQKIFDYKITCKGILEKIKVLSKDTITHTIFIFYLNSF